MRRQWKMIVERGGTQYFLISCKYNRAFANPLAGACGPSPDEACFLSKAPLRLILPCCFSDNSSPAAARFSNFATTRSFFCTSSSSGLPPICLALAYKQGSSSMPSADIIPSAPVVFKLLTTSSQLRTLPLAKIGTFTTFLMAATCSKWAGPSRLLVAVPLYRAWTAIKLAPAASNCLTIFRVASRSSSKRILQKTGIGNPSASVRMIEHTSSRSGSSNRYDPKWPLWAIRCGHPKLRSTASTSAATSLAAFRSTWGSFPQKWATSGRSPSQVWNPFSGAAR
mmetsp:Transcript_10584/g.23347  ORF Transcript_10584/g.23347 Transcript_10584/m.23347 type:complete len:282 (-) Transcript_10584:188-1033(-)